MTTPGRNARESTESKDWRMFCAIAVSDEIRDALARHIRAVRERAPDVAATWSRANNIHITLKFFGNVDIGRVPSLSQAIEKATAGAGRFDLAVGETGAFPKSGPARVLWIGVDDPSGNLQRLHSFIDEETSRVGFAKEDRPFHPHLTITRIRKLEGVKTLRDIHRQIRFEPIHYEVREVLLIRSELRSGGSKHTVISRHVLSRML